MQNQYKPNKSKIQNVPIDLLEHDPANPRLPALLRNQNEEKILEYMLKDENIPELMVSIGEQGYFHGEPLLITPNSHGKFYVVEGNRRLTALQLLSEPDKAPIRKKLIADISERFAEHIPSEVPAIIYKQREDILSYLGYRHITGVKAWDSLSKAKYIRSLYEAINQTDRNHGEITKEIARTVGSRANYVNRILFGLKIFDIVSKKDFYYIKDLGEEGANFSLLTTALSYDSISTFLGLEGAEIDEIEDRVDRHNLEELIKVIYEKNSEGTTRLRDSRNIKVLAKVLQNPKSTTAFLKEKKPLQEALLLSEEPETAFGKSIVRSLEDLKTANQILHLIQEPDESHLDLLRELNGLSQQMGLILKSKGSKNEPF